ncbi:spermidine synthase [Collinsella tanakaei]|uniref:spermidine synthase n=1 Tax=Collinsella tanakaei TaxID=626935 RepID=UPI0025A31CAA|nr:fused MFS/spermidine synthase [Collinsella tanakaei]MDM8301738.1 fused MFS/spermidine synthase [Collinsella tanakaei]
MGRQISQREVSERRRAGGGLPTEVVDVVVILFIAIAFTVGGMSGAAAWAMALLFALSSVIAIVYLRLDPHVAHTAGGFAFVRTRRLADGSLARILRTRGVYQSATHLDERRFEPVFAYQRGFSVVFDVEDAMRAASGHGISRVLALGGGGYAWPKYALTEHPDLAMTVVEIDPEVTSLARRLFFLDELERIAGARLQLVCDDGRTVLERDAAEGAAYDVIVNDTFSGAEPVRGLATIEAMRAARSCLTPGGIYITNVVSRGEGTDVTFLRDVVATLSAVFAHVWVLPVTEELFAGEDNYLVVASDAAYAWPDAVPFDREFLGEVLED